MAGTASAPALVLPPNWRVMSLAEALSTPIESPPWRIRGLVAEGGGTLVSAHPHGMKSLSWLQACMEAPLHGKVWDHFQVTGVGRTLFLETEDPQWMVLQRVQQLAKGLGVQTEESSEAGFFLGCLGPFDLVALRAQIKHLLDKYKPDLVVLSTLQGLLGGRDWTQQKEMADVNALQVEISRDYCPLIMITHSPWDARHQRAAGTITQAANYMTTCHFQKSIKKGETFVKVEVDSKLGMEEPEFSLRLVTEGTEVRKLVYQGHEQTQSEKVDAYLQSSASRNSSDIAEMFGVSTSLVRRRKRKLAR